MSDVPTSQPTPEANPGRRELIFIALIVSLGVSMTALLIDARVKLQNLGSTLQSYLVSCERISRHISHLTDTRAKGSLNQHIAAFLSAQIREELAEAKRLSGAVNTQIDQLSRPMARQFAGLDAADIEYIRNDSDARLLRSSGEQVVATPFSALPTVLDDFDTELIAAVRYGDALDEQRYRVARVAEFAVRSSQPLLLLLMAIGSSVLLGILAVWIRALRPAIAQLQSSNAALESASAALTEQNLALIRREVESLAAQRVAKFGYWIVDGTGKLGGSEGLAQILGVKVEALPQSLEQMASIGQSGTHLGQATDIDIMSGYRELCRSDGAREFMRVIVGGNGDERIIRERVESFVEPQTRSRYVIGIMMDVSEQAQAQARVARADKLDSIAVLTGSIAHDVNNVLSIIRGSIDLLEQMPETVQARVRAIRRAVANATGLTSRLSLISKGEAEATEVFDPQQALAECVNLFKSNALTDVVVALDLHSDGPQFIRMSRGQFENAILNILINSREALADRTDGVIRIVCRYEKSTYLDVRDGLKLAGDFVRIEISDNGGGMGPQVLRRAVDPFFSTKQHHSARPRGLGLWSLYQLVNSANGELSISSKEGQGTTVIVQLPLYLASGPSDEPKVPGRIDPAVRQGAGILIVDDEEDLLVVINEQLMSLGYKTWTASSISSALKLLDEVPSIMVIVSDVNLRHGETGLQLAAHVRRINADKAIIFISGYLTASQAGGEFEDIVVVRKPIDLTLLDAEIQRALDDLRSKP